MPLFQRIALDAELKPLPAECFYEPPVTAVSERGELVDGKAKPVSDAAKEQYPVSGDSAVGEFVCWLEQ